VGIFPSEAALQGLSDVHLKSKGHIYSNVILISGDRSMSEFSAAELSRVLKRHSKWLAGGGILVKGHCLNLWGTDLRFADLSSANLKSAILHSADLRFADLADLDLCNANLILAFIMSADLSGANLTGADLTSS
jgi:uncharacterized protein YjbI with pentapeptide repeats